MASLYTTFIKPADLETHLKDPNWIIIDCSSDLLDPKWGKQQYLKNHIPGAQFASLDEDLASPKTPHTGRHPLPDLATLAKKLSVWGIDQSKQVVVYDNVAGGYAARLWWLLKYFGHEAVAILEGGFQLWEKKGFPLHSGEEPLPAAADFVIHLQPDLVVHAESVENIHQDPQWRLIDARAAVRYKGEQEPIDPVAGHIPGAINRFHGLSLDAEGNLLPQQVLRKDFLKIMDGVSIEKTVCYCGSGVTACFNIAVMEYNGLGRPKLYVGAWSDWITDPKRPVVKGSEPG